MQKQTFAHKLWLPFLASLVCLAAIRGFDAWLWGRLYRMKRASVTGRDAGF